MKDRKAVNIEIGKRLKQSREAAGLTQERFAEMIGMGTKSVSAFERGTVGVSLPALQRICKVLSISSDVILFGSECENDAKIVADRLAQLPSEQFEIARDIINKLIEGFALAGSKSV